MTPKNNTSHNHPRNTPGPHSAGLPALLLPWRHEYDLLVLLLQWLQQLQPQPGRSPLLPAQQPLLLQLPVPLRIPACQAGSTGVKKQGCLTCLCSNPHVSQYITSQSLPACLPAEFPFPSSPVMRAQQRLCQETNQQHPPLCAHCAQ